MDLEDDQDNWDNEMTKINEMILKQAAKNGISKEDYYNNYNFEKLNITDASAQYHIKIADNCVNCKKAASGKCQRHQYLKLDNSAPKGVRSLSKEHKEAPSDMRININFDRTRDDPNRQNETAGGLKR